LIPEAEESPITNKELPISKDGIANVSLLPLMIGNSLLDIGYWNSSPEEAASLFT
jgi:hypothetical protein